MSPGPDPSLTGLRFVVTAGGTREPIDPVRYIGNRSSGKMGNELAAAAIRQGAEVTLVTAGVLPPAQPGLTVCVVATADEMHAAVRSTLAGSARPHHGGRSRRLASESRQLRTSSRKVPPRSRSIWSRPSISSAPCAMTRSRPASSRLDSRRRPSNVIDNARAKLDAKHLDLVDRKRRVSRRHRYGGGSQ